MPLSSIARTLLTATILALAITAGGGCQSRPGAESTVQSESAVRDFAERAPERLGFSVASSNNRAAAPDDLDDDHLLPRPEGHALRGRAPGEGHTVDARVAESQDDEDEEAKDYWREVSFDRESFDEARRFVDRHYIDDEIDHKRAYIEAAGFALASLSDAPLGLLPRTFFEQRRGHPDEEGRLDGQLVPLPGDTGYVVFKIPEEARERLRRRLSDDDIRQLRLRDRARHALLERHWAKVAFGERDFSKLIEFAKSRLPEDGEHREDDIYIAAAQGYLYSLDPHSSLVSAKAWEESTRETEDASFDGIGAILTQRDNETIVESPIEGQPAVQAGLRAGDVILAVDDQDVRGVPLFRVVRRIRGPRGTNVTLRVRRVGEPEDLKITITRAHIDIKNVDGRILDEPYEDLGYIKMTGFVRTTAEKFDKKYRALNKQARDGKLRGLIFDLRNDTGGLLSQAVAVADRFLSGGVIVAVRNKSDIGRGMAGLISGREEMHRATENREVDVPVVVLVNDATASAAEIVASALQENRRALVIGDRTFGKASVQTLYPPPGDPGYFIKLTVARYYSPSGRTIQLTGVAPDVPVPPDIDGDMPLGFREENLRNPLPPEEIHYHSPMEGVVPILERCVEKTGRAREIHEKDPNPAIRFDNQLMLAADYLECLISIEDTPAARRN